MSTIKVAGAALNQTSIDWKNNTAHIKQAIFLAKTEGVDILCLPELSITGYGCEDMFLGTWIYKKAAELLEDIRKECKDITVAIGVPVRYEGKNYNTACLIHNTRILGFSAKQYLANEGVHYELRWFTPWPAGEISQVEVNGKQYDIGDKVYELHGIKVAFEICEDAWREESRPGWRHKERAVDLILNPSASHFAFEKTHFRERLVLEGSEAFNCAYVFANMLGNEAGRMVYDGEIMIARKGQLLKKNKRFSFKDINLLSASIDFQHPENSDFTESEDSSQKEVEFTRAECLALFDYMRKSRSKGFVLSLSGGADSSTCAILVTEMIRKGVAELGLTEFLRKAGFVEIQEEAMKLQTTEEQCRFITGKVLTTAYQATVNSSETTFKAAQTLAHAIGATFYHWYIDDEVRKYTETVENAIQRSLTWEQDDITLQNIQARARSPIIWMLANINNALLITTSNRSEGDVGYATMDGDTSGSIAPIAAVDKQFILQWLKWAEEELGYKGLAPVNRINPTAELRPLEQAQSDEADLMPYAFLEVIERLAIRDRHPPADIYHILNEQKLETSERLKEYIIKFFRLWSRNQWKRERIAPAFHMDDFNVDPRTWCRFPILSGGFREELEELKNL